MIRFDLSKYRRPGDTFFECGTGGGDGIRVALEAGFERIISVELHQPRADAAKHRFRFDIADGRVTVVEGMSCDVMGGFLSTDPGRVVWWLDAHVDHPGLPNALMSCPLLGELELLAVHKRQGDTILVDDRRLFGGKGWGKCVTEEAVRAALAKIAWPRWIGTEDNYVPDDVLVYDGGPASA